jgi:hypothetical protein
LIKFRNGKSVTTKTTTIVNGDGSKEVTEEVIEGGNLTSKKMFSIGAGER